MTLPVNSKVVSLTRNVFELALRVYQSELLGMGTGDQLTPTLCTGDAQICRNRILRRKWRPLTRYVLQMESMFVAHLVKGYCCYRKVKTDHGWVHSKNSYAPLNLSQRTIRGLRRRKISKSHAAYNGRNSKLSPENGQIASS